MTEKNVGKTKGNVYKTVLRPALLYRYSGNYKNRENKIRGGTSEHDSFR